MHQLLLVLLAGIMPSVWAASPCTGTSPWSANFTAPFEGARNATLHIIMRTNGTRVIGGTGPDGTTLDRSFTVRLPADYDFQKAQERRPVVLSFHGAGKTDANQAHIDQFQGNGTVELAGQSLIAVYPLGAYGPGKSGDGKMRAWEGAPYAAPGVDDIAFTTEIVKQVKANLCVDEKRFYAAGKSNGGGFTNLLACTPSTSNLFAAFAPVSAALYPGTHPIDGCTPARSGIPLINFHGLSDTTIPFGGQTADDHNNTAYKLPNITEYREAWAIRNGCTSKEPTSPVAHPFSKTTVKTWECSASGIVEGWTMQDLGHSWPTIEGLDGTKKSKASFDATPAAIIPFFSRFTLP